MSYPEDTSTLGSGFVSKITPASISLSLYSVRLYMLLGGSGSYSNCFFFLVEYIFRIKKNKANRSASSIIEYMLNVPAAIKQNIHRNIPGHN